MDNATKKRNITLALCVMHQSLMSALAVEALDASPPPKKKRRVWVWPYLQKRPPTTVHHRRHQQHHHHQSTTRAPEVVAPQPNQLHKTPKKNNKTTPCRGATLLAVRPFTKQDDLRPPYKARVRSSQHQDSSTVSTVSTQTRNSSLENYSGNSSVQLSKTKTYGMAISSKRGVKRPKVVEESESSDFEDDQPEDDFEREIKREEDDYLDSSNLEGDSFMAYPDDEDSMKIKEEDLDEVDIKEEVVEDWEAEGSAGETKTKETKRKGAKKVKFSEPEPESDNSDFSESDNEEDNFADDDSEKEEGEGKKSVGSGLANVMAKILSTKKSEDVILSKAKTDKEVKKTRKLAKEDTFEIVDGSGQVKKEPIMEIKEEEEDRKPDISLHDREIHDDDTPATRTTAATTTTTTTTTATTTGVGVSHGDPDTPSPASEDEEVVVVPAIKVPRKPRTRNHPPMKPGAAIDSVIDGAKHFLSEFKELSGDRDTEAARHFLESLLPMLLKVGPSLMPIFRIEITACLRKYEQATKQGAEMASHDLKYHIINSEYCPAPSPPKAQPQQQQQQLLMLEPQQLQQLQQLQQQLQQPQQQQPQLVPQLPATFPATFPSIRQQGQPAVTSVTPQQLQLLQQQYLLRSPSTSSIGVPANNTTDLNMSLLMDMQLPGQASTASTPAKAPPQQSTTTLHTPTSSADF